MRLFPIVTAITVMAALYLLVFERDRILDFASGGSGTTEAVVEQPVETAEVTEELAEEVAGRVSVVAMRSEAAEITNAVLVRGRTEAARQVDVRAETSGKVVSEPLRKGSTIEMGQMLCKLDPGTREVSLAEARARIPEAAARIPEAQARLPEAQARVLEAQARVTEADINLRAAQRLSQDGFASETRVASAEAAHEAAMAAVESAKAGVASADAGVQSASAGVQSAEVGVAAAEKEIDRLTLTAPFSGLLESDTAETGSLLQPGALCATIIQLDPIKLVGFIPETDVARVKVGAMAGARLATGQNVAGQVTFLSRSADPTTRTFRIEVQVPNSDHSIGDGQTAEIVIGADGETAHLLPLSSLTLDDNGRLGVRTVDDNSTVAFNGVEVVRDTVDGIWVTGLPEKADVIVVGQEYVTAGVPVQVAYKEATQ